MNIKMQVIGNQPIGQYLKNCDISKLQIRECWFDYLKVKRLSNDISWMLAKVCLNIKIFDCVHLSCALKDVKRIKKI